MKRIMFYMAALICLTSVFTSCSKDEESLVTPSGEKLVTPTVRAALDEPNGQSPLTGILQAYPCQSESSTFFGNYVNGKLLPVCATYHIVDGHVSGTNSPLSLPAGYYNVVYWATPNYEVPTFAEPEIHDPALHDGVDVSTLYFSLRENIGEDTYSPVYDLVHAVQETHTAEDFQATLRRVVAGLKVTVTRDDRGAFSSDIAGMQVRIGGIAEKLNFYTGEPENQTKTVKFDLERSTDGTSMSNATVMLFPSAPNPTLELRITRADGSVETLSQNLTSTLSANTRLTLAIVIKERFPGGNTGKFLIENWREEQETIEFTVDSL